MHDRQIDAAFSTLGSLDSDVRENAYSVLAAYAQDPAHGPYLPGILMRSMALLREGIARRDPDAVFLRAFAVLVVGEVLDADARQRVLTQPHVRAALALLLWYTRCERDTRGFVERKGWAHAYAHLADALAAAAAHPLVARRDIVAILRGVSNLVRRAAQPLAFDEDERLALTVATCVRRQPNDPERWHTWLTRLLPGPLYKPPEVLARQARAKAFLRCVAFRLRWAGYEAHAATAEDVLRAADVYGLPPLSESP